MYKKYIKKSILIFSILIFSIMLINFTVDPGEIYLKKIIADKKAAEFSDELFNSQYGIIQSGWNERLIKTTLARRSGEFDCIIVGSSHIMQISSIRNTGKIKTQCSKLLNLGVSGGSIEDIAIFSYLILNNPTLPKRVFIDIDPWSLKFNMDSRHGAYQELYNSMNILLQDKSSVSTSYYLKGLKNLINGEYLYYSLESLFGKNKKQSSLKSIFNKKITSPTTSFSYKEGYKESLTLPDGSHLYSSSYIKKQKTNNPNITLGGGDYKITGKIYEQTAVDYLQKLLYLYELNHVNVSFILTPYHPNVFKKGDTKAVQFIRIIEEKTIQLAKINNIKIYGSFFPEKIGCNSNEYFDFMHATNECLNRINFSE